ncbi:hypothetical protein [Methanobrevibacter sp.]|uniref:hypothetical protein n=1 Tax=Methanobrevibacter sp. TaxID=66852 RepID=UPI0038904CCC
MNNSEFSRVIIINFISALIVTLVACLFLDSFDLMDMMYVANIFGIYFLVVYGIEMLVQSGQIPNDYRRFIIALIFIVIFDLIFLYLIPLLFGADVFSAVNYFSMDLDGFKMNFIFNAKFYLAVFAIIMLYFNYKLFKIHE